MKYFTPIKAIRAKCLDCCGGSKKEVQNCKAVDSCPIFPYRAGKRPDNRKGQGNEERNS